MIGASKLLYWDSLLNLVNGTSALLEKPMWVKQVLWDCSPRDSAPHRLIQWLQCVALEGGVQTRAKSWHTRRVFETPVSWPNSQSPYTSVAPGKQL